LKTASPNPAANPSYYFASQILSGRDGLERGAGRRIRSRGPSIPAQEPDRAIERLEEDGFYKKAIGPTSWRASRISKRAEWSRYLITVSEWEQREYFSLQPILECCHWCGNPWWDGNAGAAQ
jgi:glutamine synthetase